MSRRERDIKQLKYGFILISIFSIFQPLFSYLYVYWDSMSQISAFISAGITIVIILALLIIQYIPYQKFKNEYSKNMALFGLVISVVNMVLISPIGGIINLITYIKILKVNK